MAELDARLPPLISTLLESRMAPLGMEALGRLEKAEADGAALDALHRDPFAPATEETPDDRFARQLDLIDAVVAGRLELELELLERSIDLAKKLSFGLRPGDSKAFATVVLVDDYADRAAAVGPRLPETDLLAAARQKRLRAFLNAWKNAVDRVHKPTAGGPDYRGG